MKRVLTPKKPVKMWIDGKCFAIPKVEKKCLEVEKADEQSQSVYEIQKNDEGKLFTSFRLPDEYYSQLPKFPQWDLGKLQATTKTKILIPKSGNLTITGDSEELISQARDEIHSAVGAIRDNVAALQFISIPTMSNEIVKNFIKFKEDILNGEQVEGMHESIFISPQKLHLTVVVFALFDEHEKNVAIQVLQDYKEKFFERHIEHKGPIRIRISGIDCMNGNKRKVNVLYANAQIVDENDDFSLQKLVNELSDHFYDAGLVRTYKENVKLHMTLINTKYRNAATSRKRWNKRISVDTTKIFENYKDFHFGECDLDSIHLSLMGSVGDDGFYKAISIIRCNKSAMHFEITGVDICKEKPNQLESIPILSNTITYHAFFKNYIQPNLPCMIKNVTKSWESHSKWLTAANTPDLNYLQQHYGSCEVTVYHCNRKYFNSQETESKKFGEFLCGWDSPNENCQYVKDWHLKNTRTNDEFYQVPLFFASDWINEYLIEKKEDDYRFVYVGKSGTWTPLHADVFNSFSWSANVCGQKKWVLFPLGEENFMRDSLGNLPYDISDTYKNYRHFEVVQNAGDAIFVPSGWYHQVWNTQDTISVNHNWVNGCNIMAMWEALESSLVNVKKEISDCIEMDGFLHQCQVVLKASFGIDFPRFFNFLKFIALKRLNQIKMGKEETLFHGHTLGMNHAKYDLAALKEVLQKFVEHPDVSVLFESEENPPEQLLSEITSI